MELLYKKRIAFILLSLFLVHTIPAHSFWGQRFCARVSAAFSTMSARVKNSSVAQKFSNFFSREKLKSTSVKTIWATSWTASCASIALLHDDIRSRIFGAKKENIEEKKSKFKTKNNKYQTFESYKSLLAGKSNTTLLAAQVLNHLDISVDIENPLAQIKNLTPQQQDAAFDYLMDIYPLKEDTNTLPTIYSIMEHLEKPKREYEKFFKNVAANTGECCRESLIWELICQYGQIRLRVPFAAPLPPRLKAKFDEVGYNGAMDFWCNRKPLPEWLVVMKDKLPCEKEDLARKKALQNKKSA